MFDVAAIGAIDYGYGTVWLEEQIVVQDVSTPFIEVGDSGSALFDMNGKLVGLMFGASSGFGWACHISNVFDELDIRLPSPACDARVKHEAYEEGCVLVYQIYSDYWAAQTFTPGSSHRIAAVKLYVDREGGLDEDLAIEITATDAFGKPTGAALTSGTIPKCRMDTTHAWVICCVTPHPLSAGTKYAIVCHTGVGGAEGHNYRWCYDPNDATYDGGDACFSIDGGINWSFDPVGSSDFLFSEWGAGGATVEFLLA